MRKLLKFNMRFLPLNFILLLVPVMVHADEVQEAIVNKLKEHTLTEAVSGLEVREGGMCLFLPKGKNFITKVAINCSRLFDTLLDDLLQGQESSLFDAELLKRLTSASVRKRMIEILQGDFSLIRNVLQKGGSLEDEKLSPVIPEVAKLLKLLQQGAFGEDESFKVLFEQVLQRNSRELLLLLAQYDNEESFSSLVEYVQKVSQSNSTSELSKYLLMLKGSQSDFIGMVIQLLKQDKQVTTQKLAEMLEFKDYVPLDRFAVIQNTLNYHTKCAVSLVPDEEDCRTIFDTLEPEVQMFFQESILKTGVQKIMTAKEVDLEKLRDLFSQVNNKDASYYALVDELVRPYLSSKEFDQESDMLIACEILGDEECIVKLRAVAAPRTATSLPYLLAGTIIFTLILFVGLFFYLRKMRRAKNVNSAESLVDPQNLDTEERAELRNLRKKFELKPLDGVTELHRSYRRMVFNVHPDKLKDGGREFVELQAQYLKTKELLDRLESEKSKKLGND